MIGKIKILLIALMTIISGKSIAFESHKMSILRDETKFSYEWLDQNNDIKNIVFYMDNKYIFSLTKGIDKSVNPHKLKVIEKYINEKASLGYFKININADGDYQYENIYSTDFLFTHLINPLNFKKYDDARVKSAEITRKILDINKDFFYQSIPLDNQYRDYRTIDYRNLYKINIEMTKSIGEEYKRKAQNTTERVILNEILSFYQSIPYSTLDDYEGGFINTNEMLVKNKGDCDSKSISFLSTLKNVYKDSSSISIYIKNHLFVGFETKPEIGDIYLTHKGKTYVLAEPVGPALAKMGVIGEYSKKEFDEGRYSIIDMN